MQKKIITYYFVALSIFTLFSFTASPSLENDDPTLFTFGNESVSKSAFIYVYEKHNAQDSNKNTKQSIDEYLNLYINFKLKVKEAESLGMDTLPHLKADLDKHYKQLAQSYLYDRNISDKLIEEAYERMTKEVKTSHILIAVDENALPNDTLKAFNKANSIHTLITEKGKGFVEMARKYSEDPSVKDNDGNLGYISAFQTVYPFESAAYNTPTGNISKPVRTQFGYHLVKVDDMRKARGKVKIAHILIKANEKDTPEQIKAKKQKACDLYKKAKKKRTNFEELAKSNSEDMHTASKGGVLEGWQSSNTLFDEIATAAFALKKGEVAKPVETELGWHIIKQIDRQTVGSYEEVKEDLKKRIEKDNRSRVSKKMFIDRLKVDYQLKESPERLLTLSTKVSNDILRGKWRLSTLKGISTNLMLFSVIIPDLESNKTNKKTFTINDFGTYMEKNQSQARSKTAEITVNRLYSMFLEKVLMDIEQAQLPTKYPEFGQLMKEFRDGNLLYELMGEKVWNKAMLDEKGLQAFYQANQKNYQWDERIDATIITCSTKEQIKTLRTRAEAPEGDLRNLEKEIKAVGGSKGFKIETKVFEKGQNRVIDSVNWKKGLSKNIENNDGTFSFVQIHQILPPEPKKLADARGYIIADYQAQLEKEWIEELREKYPVTIDQAVLKTLYK